MNKSNQHEETAGRAKSPGLLLGEVLVLGIDTCGATGSVALTRLRDGAEIQVLGQRELAGRSYSATLISSIDELLQAAGAHFNQLAAIVIVNGPGSFTGVRIGVSAAKGLAEGRDLGLVPVSRLEVLAARAQQNSAALDAHRHEIFLRMIVNGVSTELLAGRDELAALESVPQRIAVCDEAAAELLQTAWPAVQLLQVDPPTAADAIRHCVARVAARNFADVALLDGHYLRRSDAEIFGEKKATAGHA